MIKVYHKNISDFDADYELRFSPMFPDTINLDSFQLVAVVNSNDLDQAFELTNHIDKSWLENDGLMPMVKEARSTSIRDIMEIDGEFYMLLPRGFKKVTEC